MDREQSRETFGKATSWEKFLELWCKFYSNEICIPAYYGKFIDGKGDNSKANEALGKIFQDITRNDLVCVDSQVSVKGEQKAYCVGYTFHHIARPLFIELNRHEGISAILLDLNATKSEHSPFFPFVTYSDWNQDRKRCEAGNRMLGNAYTHLGIGFENDTDDISEWLSDDMKEIIEESNMCQLLIWDACTSSQEFHLFEVISSSLNRVKMQIELYTAVKNGSSSVSELIERMKHENIIPDIQQSCYGEREESMIACASINILSAENDEGREKFKKILNILMNEVICLDVNMYRTLKNKIKKSNYILDILRNKLPAWFKDD